MPNPRSWLMWVGLWVFMSAAVWGIIVPRWIDGGDLALMSAWGFALCAVFVLTVRAARPTRSIAHVLYDVEHEDDVRADRRRRRA